MNFNKGFFGTNGITEKSGFTTPDINEALVKYRISSNSLSSNKFKSIKQIWEIQTQDEEINKLRVCLNTFRFIINALKKYLGE